MSGSVTVQSNTIMQGDVGKTASTVGSPPFEGTFAALLSGFLQGASGSIGAAPAGIKNPADGTIPLNGKIPVDGQMAIVELVPVVTSIPVDGKVSKDGTAAVDGRLPTDGKLPTGGSAPVDVRTPVDFKIAIGAKPGIDATPAGIKLQSPTKPPVDATLSAPPKGQADTSVSAAVTTDSPLKQIPGGLAEGFVSLTGTPVPVVMGPKGTAGTSSADQGSHGKSGPHSKSTKASSDLAPAIIQPTVQPPEPGMFLTALNLSSQTQSVSQTRSVQNALPGQMGAAGPDAAGPPSGHIKEGGAHQNEAQTPLAPLTPPGEQQAHSQHPGMGAPATASASGPVNATVISTAVADVTTLLGRSDLLQTVPVSTTSPRLRLTQEPSLATDHAAPADQIQPAMVSLLKTTDGVQSVTVRLQPPELGQVQIRVDRTVDGIAHVHVTTERPETLQLLQRDQPRLEQALDQAGLSSNGRSVTFQTVTPDQVSASASRPDSMSAGSNDSGQGQSGGAWRQSEDGRRDHGGGPGPDHQQTRARWFRAGLDITA